MSTIRQKRVSCEACRARKLKCSGKHSGCSRCVHLGLVCEFRDRGMPGRPRKWSTTETLESSAQQSQPQQVLPHKEAQPDLSKQPLSEPQESHDDPPTVSPEESSAGTSVSTEYLSVPSQEWSSPQDHCLGSDIELPPVLSLLDFNTSENLGSLSLDPFRACLSNEARQTRQTEQSPSATSVILTGSQEPCDCAKDVFEILRVLQRDSVSHGTVHLLRQATDLLDKLLVCPICYDTSKPPRITLQNVLLLGRLFLGVISTYHEYFKWVKDYYRALAEMEMIDTVYLPTNADSTRSMLGFEIGGEQLYDIIAHGLRNDVKRLSHLATRFAIRQHNRHLIGHESCLDTQGRCWKEEADVDPDPSDVCPKSAMARILTPCYRIVDEVNTHVNQLKDAIM
ncbi:hypothetical protein B0I35DRAFT_383381 [Stachybotrys elegans]|uniref:Zn(2)-C6 fungal-type domain-containing protein n=1 Tax=Stachybotrys elegans TaxID=80388 RepID=A0A8K0SCP0_9HYPO|nr:hypothetical protein B0I35DRAFT_383381 [Stachybotrys elegans]